MDEKVIESFSHLSGTISAKLPSGFEMVPILAPAIPMLAYWITSFVRLLIIFPRIVFCPYMNEPAVKKKKTSGVKNLRPVRMHINVKAMMQTLC